MSDSEFASWLAEILKGITWPQAFLLAVALICVTSLFLGRWPWQKEEE